MAGEHAAQHDEVGAAAEGLGEVAGRGAAAVGANATFEAVRGVGALDHRRELRIADAGHDARGAHRARTDPNLDDVGAGENQFLGHLAGDDIAGHDGELGITLAKARDESDEALGVAVGDVDADVLDGVACAALDALELVEVFARDAHRVEGRRLELESAEKAHQVFNLVVLVQRHRQPLPRQRARHRKGTHGVHVGGDHRHAVITRARVLEAEGALDVDRCARRQRRALGPDQHVPEVELAVAVDVHRCLRVSVCRPPP